MKPLGNIMVVDLTRGRIDRHPFPAELAAKFLAGRGINSYFLFKEMDRKITNPLSPDNVLIMSCGLLTGTAMPASARLHVSALSPLTLGLGSSNVGGGFGVRLRAAGIQTIIFKGKASSPVWVSIQPKTAAIYDAASIWGLDTKETADVIYQGLESADAEIAVIGPGGENAVRYAGIMMGHGHTAGRTGMGAVMGSKNLKAIAVQAPLPHIKTKSKLKKAVIRYNQSIMAAPRYKLFAKTSNTFVVDWADDLGILPTRNFQAGEFEGSKRINGDDMLRHVIKRKSCYRCPVHCRAKIFIENGPYAGTQGERPDLEPIMSFGAKCGLDNSDAILYLHNLCNRLGIDSLSAASTIAFAMEAFEKKDISPVQTGGLNIQWGDQHVIKVLVEQIAFRKGFGNILADGVARAAQTIGGKSHQYAYHSKGLELTGFDPRGLKATGLGYAVSTRGGDFTSVYALPETKWDPDKCEKNFGTPLAGDRLAHAGKGKVVRMSVIVSAVIDALGICKVPALSLIGEFDLKREAELVSLIFNQPMDREKLFKIGERIFNLENLFNLYHSPWVPLADIPGKFKDVSMDKGGSKGHKVDIDNMLQDFYQAMRWNHDGRPKPDLIEDLGLTEFSNLMANDSVKFSES